MICGFLSSAGAGNLYFIEGAMDLLVFFNVLKENLHSINRMTPSTTESVLVKSLKCYRVNLAGIGKKILMLSWFFISKL